MLFFKLFTGQKNSTTLYLMPSNATNNHLLQSHCTSQPQNNKLYIFSHLDGRTFLPCRFLRLVLHYPTLSLHNLSRSSCDFIISLRGDRHCHHQLCDL